MSKINLLISLILAWQVGQGIPAYAFVNHGHSSHSSKKSGFFHRHPKLKKYLLLGGIGAATGGVGAAVLGGSMATHMAVGAASSVGRAKYKEAKERKRKARLAAKNKR